MKFSGKMQLMMMLKVIYVIYRYMLFGIYLRTPLTPKFWHTYVITHGDFTVILIVEPCKCDQVSNLWQQLVLASELESDLRDTVD